MKELLHKIVFWPERLVPWARRTGLSHLWIIRVTIDFLLLPADWRIVSHSVTKVTGHRPQWFKKIGFVEWVFRSKLTRRRKRYPVWADKLAVRDYITAQGFSQYLSKLYWRGYSLEEARKVALPEKFVIKCNHTSGGVIIVTDAKTFDWDVATVKTQQWLESDYAASSAEWQYRWIKPELFIEEFLEQSDGLLNDYKIHCFRGEPKMVQVIDRVGTHCECCYDAKWKNLGWNLTYNLLQTSVSRPASLDGMFAFCRQITSGERYLRVDLYYISGRIVFGEITLHPGGGILPKMSPECETQMTKWLYGCIRQ